MALINRITRLFSADLHAVIDRLEEPHMLLKQSVREMEEALGLDRQQLKALQQQQTLMAERMQDLESSICKINDELDVCFTAENESLARVLIKRKLESQQLDTALKSKHKSQTQTIVELQSRIDDHSPRLVAMQQKLELLAEETPQQYAEPGWSPTSITISDADVEVALLGEKQQRSR